MEFKTFRPFDDVSEEGYHGYVPSGQWLRDVYDQFIEEHWVDITQHMAMLIADVIAIDHSHKVMPIFWTLKEMLTICSVADHETCCKNQRRANIYRAPHLHKQQR